MLNANDRRQVDVSLISAGSGRFEARLNGVNLYTSSHRLPPSGYQQIRSDIKPDTAEAALNNADVMRRPTYLPGYNS